MLVVGLQGAWQYNFLGGEVVQALDGYKGQQQSSSVTTLAPKSERRQTGKSVSTEERVQKQGPEEQTEIMEQREVIFSGGGDERYLVRVTSLRCYGKRLSIKRSNLLSAEHEGDRQSFLMRLVGFVACICSPQCMNTKTSLFQLP